MKRNLYLIVAGIFVLSLLTLRIAGAATKDETRLDTQATDIDKTADTTEGSAVVVARLEKQFNVTSTQIDTLRDKRLGYGEIAIVFSLAGKLPGGITDSNIDKIMAMRSGPPVMGWGEIANKLGFKLGPVISSVMKVNKESQGDIKGERAERLEHEGHGERHGESTEHDGMGAGGMSHGRGY